MRLITFFILIFSSVYPQSGIVNSYFPDRKLRQSISYVNDVLDGVSYWFYENGNLREEKNYSNGKLNGWVKYYYNSGLVKEEISVKDGVLNGISRVFYENGALKEVKIFEMGRLIKITSLEMDKNYLPPLSAYSGNRQSEIKKNRDVFICEVEECAIPAGGIQEIQNNVEYPYYAKLYGLEGIVKIKALVSETGDVLATSVISGLGLGCDEAAQEAVSNTKFIPGFSKGQAVKSEVIFNVDFRLSDSERANIQPMTPDISNKIADSDKSNSQAKNNMEIDNKIILNSVDVKNFDCAAEICPVPANGLNDIMKNLVIPQRVKRLKLRGDVIVEADIDEYGLVRDTKVLKGIGYGADDAVEVAILKTQFKPGYENGNPVRAWVKIIVPVKAEND